MSISLQKKNETSAVSEDIVCRAEACDCGRMANDADCGRVNCRPNQTLSLDSALGSGHQHSPLIEIGAHETLDLGGVGLKVGQALLDFSGPSGKSLLCHFASLLGQVATVQAWGRADFSEKYGSKSDGDLPDGPFSRRNGHTCHQ